MNNIEERLLEINIATEALKEEGLRHYSTTNIKNYNTAQYARRNRLGRFILNDMANRYNSERENNPNFNEAKFFNRYMYTLVGIWVLIMVIVIVIFWRG